MALAVPSRFPGQTGDSIGVGELDDGSDDDGPDVLTGSPDDGGPDVVLVPLRHKCPDLVVLSDADAQVVPGRSERVPPSVVRTPELRPPIH